MERVKENRNELVILDTKDMQSPVAFVQLPFHVKGASFGANPVDTNSNLACSANPRELGARGEVHSV